MRKHPHLEYSEIQPEFRLNSKLFRRAVQACIDRGAGVNPKSGNLKGKFGASGWILGTPKTVNAYQLNEDDAIAQVWADLFSDDP